MRSEADEGLEFARGYPGPSSRPVGVGDPLRPLAARRGFSHGSAQTIGAKINPEWQILAGHIAFLIVLVLKPRGLFPRSVD